MVLSVSNSGKMFANNDWSKAMFSLFASVEATIICKYVDNVDFEPLLP